MPAEAKTARAVLVFIDGTLCDDRHRLALYGTEEFYSQEQIMADAPALGSVDCMRSLSKKYRIIYMGARPPHTLALTAQWLHDCGFPEGKVYLAEKHQERMAIVLGSLKSEGIAAGIGDRWDDNELHLALGCLSIIVEEYKGNWNTVTKYLL
jgi:uncharacterized HAD superfamily protein